MKTNPLNHIKIASPCSADWNEMRGDDRQRYCSECKLNVYNLSEMNQREAENFLFEAEGRVCVRLYRRSDGTVITQDCPVGWQLIKRKVSRAATAVFGLIAGFFGGVWGFSQINFDNSKLLEEVTVEKESLKENTIVVEVGGLTDEQPLFPKATMGKPLIKPAKTNEPRPIVCRLGSIRALEDEPVELWIK